MQITVISSEDKLVNINSEDIKYICAREKKVVTQNGVFGHNYQNKEIEQILGDDRLAIDAGTYVDIKKVSDFNMETCKIYFSNTDGDYVLGTKKGISELKKFLKQRSA